MATLFDENSNLNGATLAALNGVAPGPSTAATSSLNSANLMNQLLSVKDSRWLQIEVCREYQRGQCSRSDVRFLGQAIMVLVGMQVCASTGTCRRSKWTCHCVLRFDKGMY